MQPELITPKQAVERTGLHMSNIYRAMEAKRLKVKYVTAGKLRRDVRIPLTEANIAELEKMKTKAEKRAQNSASVNS